MANAAAADIAQSVLRNSPVQNVADLGDFIDAMNGLQLRSWGGPRTQMIIPPLRPGAGATRGAFATGNEDEGTNALTIMILRALEGGI